MTDHSDLERPWFFVVRQTSVGEHCYLEYGDQKGTRQELEDKSKGRGSQIERFELPATVNGKPYEPPLTELVALWKAGARIKPTPKPAPPPKDKTFNSIRRRGQKI